MCSSFHRLRHGIIPALVLGLVSLARATPAYTPPTGLEAADVQDAVFDVIGPAIPVILGIGATLAVVWAIYKVITRRTTSLTGGRHPRSLSD